MTIIVNIISNDLYLLTNISPLQVYLPCKSKYIRYYFKSIVIEQLKKMYSDKKDEIDLIFKKSIQCVNISKNPDNYINKYDIII